MKEYGDGSQRFGAKVTPVQLAAALETDNQQALNTITSISTSEKTQKFEIEDVRAWGYSGIEFARKIRTAVALNQKTEADAVPFVTEAQQY